MPSYSKNKRKGPRKLPDMATMDKAYTPPARNEESSNLNKCKKNPSYRASHSMPPTYSMRAKVSFGAQIQKNPYPNCPTAGPLDIGKIRYEPPHFSIRKRTCKMLQLPGQSTDSVPGPGTYPVPSTTYFDHPCLKMPGRTTMRGPPRFDPNPKDLPGPQSYDQSNFYAILGGKPPKFSMRIKPKMGGNINTVNDKVSPPLDYNKVMKQTPNYSIRKRTCKMLQLPGQSTDSVPGPGTYPVPSTTDFSHPAMKMPGRTKFGSAPRFRFVDDD